MTPGKAGAVGAPRAILIGAGRMGSAHAEALSRLGVVLAGVCDTRGPALDAFCERHGVPATARFSRTADLYAAFPSPDLVIVATTADAHCSLVVEAAERGVRKILCEKPIARSVDECEAIREVCERRGTALAVNHQMRFMSQYTLVRELFDSGRLGALASMTVVAGCFGLSMNGSHYVEAFRYLTGSMPASVAAWFSEEPVPNPRGTQFADQAGQMRIVSEDGRRMYIDASHDQGHGMTVTYAGSWGHVFVDELAGQMIVTERLPEHREQPMTRYGMPWERTVVEFAQADNVGPTQAVVDALMRGADYPGLDVGAMAVSVLACAHRSDAEGHRVVGLDDPGEYRKQEFQWA